MDPHLCLAEAITLLTGEMREWRHGEIRRLISKLATKDDLRKLQDTIMASIQDLTAAAIALSTASDSTSLKLDALITKVDAVVAALKDVTLPPEAVAAITALKASTATAVTAGDKLDAEVAKLDTLLPTPAPAGTL